MRASADVTTCETTASLGQNKTSAKQMPVRMRNLAALAAFTIAVLPYGGPALAPISS